MKYKNGSVTAGKIDFTTFPDFSAYLNNTQTNSNNAIIKIDTIRWDTHGAFNTTNWRYIAPITGVYHFDGNIQTSVGTSVLAGLVATSATYGNDQKRGVWVANSASFIASHVSGNFRLAAGEYVQLICLQMGGTATTAASTTSDQATWFDGHMLKRL